MTTTTDNFLSLKSYLLISQMTETYREKLVGAVTKFSICVYSFRRVDKIFPDITSLEDYIRKHFDFIQLFSSICVYMYEPTLNFVFLFSSSICRVYVYAMASSKYNSTRHDGSGTIKAFHSIAFASSMVLSSYGYNVESFPFRQQHHSIFSSLVCFLFICSLVVVRLCS